MEQERRNKSLVGGVLFRKNLSGWGKIKKKSSSHCWTNEKTEFSKSRVQGEGCYCDIIVENESTLCLHKT
jgi:hypothetical protein